MQVSITCDHTVEDVVFLLKRNWFFSEQDLLDLCWELPQDVWDGVLERIDEYPREVRDVLHDTPTVKNGKIKIREMSDKEYYDMRIHEEEDLDRRKRQHRARFVPPPRDREAVDDEYERILEELNEKQLILKDVSKAWKRDSHQPIIRDTEDRIRVLQNEFETISKRVVSLNKIWNELQWLDALLQDAAKGCI
jgi:hypothetical protein